MVDIIRAAPDALAQWFVEDLAREFRAAMAPSARTQRFTLAVPGGSVSSRFLPGLVTAPVDWDRVELFWTDERAVPPTSPDSNYALAQRSWLAPARVPEARVHRMPGERDDLDDAAAAYGAALEAAAGSPPILDYVLLGVGEDGHVASIFPGIAPSGGTDAVGWTDGAPKPPARRMTLTMETLVRARRVVVAAFDAGKAAVIAQALDDRSASTPLAVLLARAKKTALLLGSEVAV